jgi:hypothetical protein
LEIEKMLKKYKINEIESEETLQNNYVFDYYSFENNNFSKEENEEIEKNK